MVLVVVVVVVVLVLVVLAVLVVLVVLVVLMVLVVSVVLVVLVLLSDLLRGRGCCRPLGIRGTRTLFERLHFAGLHMNNVHMWGVPSDSLPHYPQILHHTTPRQSQGLFILFRLMKDVVQRTSNQWCHLVLHVLIRGRRPIQSLFKYLGVLGA
jgi:hypothetical protein